MTAHPLSLARKHRLAKPADAPEIGGQMDVWSVAGLACRYPCVPAWFGPAAANQRSTLSTAGWIALSSRSAYGPAWEKCSVERKLDDQRVQSGALRR
jgi:hypothetical protein